MESAFSLPRLLKWTCLMLSTVAIIPYYLVVRLVVFFISKYRRKSMLFLERGDNAWLAIDAEERIHWVRLVHILKGGGTSVTLEEIQDRVEQKLVSKHPKLRCRLDRFAGLDVWVEDDEYDIRNHVTYVDEESVQLQSQTGASSTEALMSREGIYKYSSREELVAAVNAAAKQKWDVRRPMWNFYLVPRSDSDEVALIFMFAHLVMDGNSVWLCVYPALSDVDENGDPLVESGNDVGKNLGLGRKLQLTLSGIRNSPAYFREQYGLLDSNPILGLAQQDTGQRDFRYPEFFDFHQFTAVAKKFGCSINDVYMSCISAAVFRHCESVAALGEEAKGQPDWRISIFAPVSFWARGDAARPMNKVVVVRAICPCGGMSAEERLKAVKASCDRYFKSSMPWVYHLFFACPPVPHQLLSRLYTVLPTSGTAAASNLRGPSRKMRFFGRDVERILFGTTLSPRIGSGSLFSLMSYNGKLGVSITVKNSVDPAGRNHAEVLQQYFREEFSALLAAASSATSSPGPTEADKTSDEDFEERPLRVKERPTAKSDPRVQ